MRRVFISYRREDSSDVTGRIYDRLVSELGADCVFKDVDSIPLGVDFRRHIRQAVERCDAVLVVVGPRWRTSVDGDGARRIDDGADFVHLEVRAALERGIPVIPVLVGGAAVPRPEELPEPLRELAFRNATNVRPDPDFHRDMDRLLSALRAADEREKPAPPRRGPGELATASVAVPRDSGRFQHDVFLSFAPEDRSWVLDSIHRPLLECVDRTGQSPRIALDWKDSEIDSGRRSLKGLDEAIAGSRRILVVASQSYVERSLCRWRLMKMAQLDSAEDRVLPILLDLQPSDPDALGREWLEIRGVEAWMTRALDPRADAFFAALCRWLEIEPR